MLKKKCAAAIKCPKNKTQLPPAIRDSLKTILCVQVKSRIFAQFFKKAQQNYAIR
jgi:hypothetical protein